MYEKHWGFPQSPFRNSLDTRQYFANGSHEEALARSQFLVDNQRQVGLLTGLPGMGKSYLLRMLQSTYRRRGLAIIQLNLAAARPTQWLWQVATQLGIDHSQPQDLAHTFDGQAILWRQIVDRLQLHRLQQRFTVLLLDDLDKATLETQQYVGRLLQADPAPRPWLATIATAAEIERVENGLLERCELQIELEPWEEAETVSFLRFQLSLVGSRDTIFSEDAMRRIHLLSHGIPRRINQLADLALLAGAGQLLEQVEAPVIEAVFEELSIQPSRPAFV